MHLVQFLLPVYDNDDRPMPRARFDRVRTELAERFDGVTAYLRAPAVGVWEDPEGDVQRDDMLLFEVVVDRLDRAWWAAYRESLAARFAQEEVLVRALPVERL